MEILSVITGGGGPDEGAGSPLLVDAAKLAPFVKTVVEEEEVLNSMKIILAKQVTRSL